MLTTLTVDVYCQKTHEGSLIYRLYVNDDLLTERTWRWPVYKTYINEIIEVELEPGSHSVRLVNADGNITFNNVTINKKTVSKTNQLQEFAFVI